MGSKQTMTISSLSHESFNMRTETIEHVPVRTCIRVMDVYFSHSDIPTRAQMLQVYVIVGRCCSQASEIDF